MLLQAFMPTLNKKKLLGMRPNNPEIQRNLTNNDIFECANKIFVPAVCCLGTYYSFYAGEYRQRIQLQTNRLVNAWVCCAFAAIYKPRIKWSRLASPEGASGTKWAMGVCMSKDSQKCSQNHSHMHFQNVRPSALRISLRNRGAHHLPIFEDM